MANSNDNSPPNDSFNRARRSSITSQTFSNLFGRSNSTSGTTPSFHGPITTAAAQDQRRRMSVTTLGLSGSSPTQTSPFTFGGRRGSVSTAGSDSIDENAIDDDDGPSRSNPTTPFVRRMSFGAQALRSVREGGSTNSAAEGGFNWGEQVRSRAESSVSQNQRPSFSTSPFGRSNTFHDRSKSISEMSAPPTAVSPPAPRPAPKKPDAFQERILKGDFYMD